MRWLLGGLLALVLASPASAEFRCKSWDKLDDAQSFLLAQTLAKRIQQEMEYPGKIKVTVIREMRAVDYAR